MSKTKKILLGSAVLLACVGGIYACVRKNRNAQQKLIEE